MKTILLLLLILLSIHSTAQVPNYVPTTGLVGYWPFSGNANDVSGNGNNGAVNGAILSPDRFGNANSSYSFNGVNCCGTPDPVQEILVNNQFLNLGQDFTISCWMKSTNVAKFQQMLFIAGAAIELNNEHVPGKLTYAVGPGAYWDLLYAQGTTTNFQNNTWYFVTLIKTGTIYSLYLNTVFEGSSVVANSAFYTQYSNLRIGSWGGGNNVFKGSLDDFAVWNRALTPTEITGIYNSTPIPPTLSIAATPSTASCPGTPVTLTANTTSGASACTATSLPSNLQTGLVGYWPFCGNASDASGNGNNGTVNGATLTADRYGNPNSAYSFIGSNQIVVSPNFYDNGWSSSTISIWFNTSSLSQQHQALFNTIPHDGEAIVWNHSAAPNKICHWKNENTSVGSWNIFAPNALNYNNVQENNWINISIVKNNMQYSYYVNGILDKVSISSIAALNQLSAIRFGSIGTTEFFNGKLDDIAIWNRALTSAEVQQLYTLNNDSPTYSWSPGGATSPSITVSPTSTTTYSCTITANSLSTTSSTSVTVLPAPTITATNNSICAGSSTTLTAATNSSSSGTIYSVTKDFTSPWSISWPVQVGGNYQLKVMGTYGIANGNQGLDAAFETATQIPYNQACTGYQDYWLLSDGCPARPTPDVFNPSHSYNYHILNSDGSIDFSYADCCYGDNVGSLYFELTSIPTTYLWSPGGATTPSITVSPTSTTTYTCTVTDANGSCSSSQTITVNPLPNVNAGPDQTICSGTSAILTATGASTYSWTGGVQNGTAFTPANSGAYTVTGTSNGCSATDEVSINVSSTPTITATNTSICEGASTTLTAAAGSTSTPNTCANLSGTLTTGLVGYWPFCGNANDTSGNSNNGTVNGATLTNDRFGNANSAYSFDGINDWIEIPNNSSFFNNTISISVWGQFNSTSGFHVTYSSVSTGSYVFSSSAIGGHTNTNLGCGGSGGVGNLSTTLNNTWHNLTAIIIGNITNFYVDGLFISSWSNAIMSCNNVNNKLYFGVDIFGLPEYSLGNYDDIGIWNRALTTAEIQQLYTQGQTTYAWSPGGATTPSIIVSPTNTTTYTCTVTDANGSCSSSQTITVNPLPNVNAGPDQTICSGTSAILTATGAITYSWTGGVQNGTAFTPANSGAYTVTGTSAAGCSSQDDVLVTVNPLPSATVTVNGATSFCSGGNTQLCAPIGTGLSYTWSGNLGTTSCINISSTQTTSVTVTNAQGCSATSLPQQVVVFSNPVANVGPDAIITCNQNASGTQIGANPNPLYTYSWSPTIGLSSATSANPIANPSSTTTYTLSVINADGCTGSNQVTVTVNNTPPISNAGLDFTKTCISNVSGSSIGATSVVGNTYSWTPTSGLSSATVANPTSNPTLTTTYTLTTTNTASGCSTTDQVTVNVNNTAPTINPIPNYSFCANESSNNILFSGTANSSFAWTNSNSNIGLSPSGNGNITSFLTQNNSNMTIVSLITVTPTLSNGCVGAPQTFSITVNPLPIVSPVNNQTVCCQGATAPISLISNLPGTLSWTSIANSPLLSSFPNSGNGNIPSFLPVNNSLTDQSILFLLTPISTQGCIGSIESVTVTVLPCNIFVDQVNNLEFCNPSNFVGITFTGNATSFLWTNNFTDSGIPTSGMDNIPSMTLTNATQQNIMSHIITTPIYESNGLTCTGNGIDFFINVYPTPMVNAGSDQTICTGANITLNGSGAHSYVWNNGVIDGISFLPISTNSYTVIGTDVNGCTNSDVVLITVGSPTSSSISASSCDTYTLNNQTYSQSGIFEQILPNTSGCDSTITLNLNMDFSPITPVITLTNGVTMTTPTQANVTYQWINCSNLTPIAGATGATFTASMNGVYAVVASNACGSDTSACSTVNSVGLETLSSNGVSVFPNPTNELLTVQVPVDFIGCQWNLVDIRGRHVLNGQVDIEQFQLNLSDFARGTYWISLGTNQPIQVVKN